MKGGDEGDMEDATGVTNATVVRKGEKEKGETMNTKPKNWS